MFAVLTETYENFSEKYVHICMTGGRVDGHLVCRHDPDRSGQGAVTSGYLQLEFYPGYWDTRPGSASILVYNALWSVVAPVIASD